MRVSEFDYDLPEDLIAQEPADRREESRLMLVNRQDGTITHERFYNLPDILHAGDLLVLNDTRVFPARILGKKASGGASIEVLLLEEVEDRNWKVMARRARRLREGTIVRFSDDFFGTIEESLSDGLFLMRFSYPRTLQDALEEHGQVPLPPYIKRKEILVTLGKCVVEIRPPINWDKGKSVDWIMDKIVKSKRAVVCYLGDDNTDEDAFRVVNKLNGISVFVGSQPSNTRAKWWLKNPYEVDQFLARIYTLLQ